MNSETLMARDLDTVRHKLRQLHELHASGTLGAAAYDESKASLERTLVDLVLNGPSPAAATPAGQNEARPSPRLLFALAAFCVAVTAAGYAWVGSPNMIGVGPGAVSTAAVARADAVASPHATTPEQIASMADQLARRLKDKPDDAEGWAMLARSYTVLSRHADAVPAYEKAVALRGDDATLLADYADALAMKNNQGLAGEPMKLVERALKLDPKNIKALSLAGTDAFDRRDYALAVQRWEQIVQIGPEDSALVQQVKGGIAEARELGKLPAAAGAMAGLATSAGTTAAAKPAANDKASVSGAVTLAPALAAKASPTDTVFITARAVDGPRMPLAVVRKQVKDLPVDFRLDDSTAMSPVTKLSGFAKVVVSARVSKSGDAIAAAGDLSGQSGTVAVGADGVRVVIDQVVTKSP